MPWLNVSDYWPEVPFIPFLDDFVPFLDYLIVTLAIVILAKFILWLGAKSLGATDTIKVSRIKPAEGMFLPVYIGLFVIALSFNQGLSLNTGFLLIFLFLLWMLFEGVSYFNPFLLFWGYRFYEVETENGVTVIIITKRKDLKKIKEFPALVRVNNFTFLDS
jgi:hypothetical protein